MRVSEGRTLHFAKREVENGTLIVVLDATSRYGLVRLMMMYTAVLWFTVLVLYVILMGRFSAHLIQPFIENDERQKRFITNASHELKTPLAVISANTEMTEVDLSGMLEEMADTFRSNAEQAGEQFFVNITPGVRIRGDKRSLQQISSVLLDNAVKYCDPGGSIFLELESRNRGKGARMIVSNTYAEGENIDVSRFFERFYRQDESHNSEQKGFGIGLSMAEEMAERMNGKLKAGYADGKISLTFEMS